MNITRLMPNFGKTDEIESKELTPEEIDLQLAEERAQRIEWHFRNVRNGPRSMSYWTTGQIRRQQDRDKKSQQRKANRRHRRNFVGKRHDLAALRGQLQAVGALPYSRGDESFKPSEALRANALSGLIDRYADRIREVTGDVEPTPEQLATIAIGVGREQYISRTVKR